MFHLRNAFAFAPLCRVKGYMLSSKLWLFCYQVLDEIDEHGIKIYSFPDCDSEDDEEFVEINQELKVEFQYSLYLKVQQIEITIP